MTLAFLGAGKMATAIAAGLVEHNLYTTDQLRASDKVAAARECFTVTTGIATTDDNRAAVADADAVVLAIKPQDVPDALPPLADALAGKLFISIAAGLSIARLAELLGHGRIIRVMPNTPAMVSRGASVFACGQAVNDADRALAAQIFGAIGIAHELPEEQLDAVTGTSGSGPAYVFEFVQAMVEGAVAQGLPREIAHDLVVQTVAGAAAMLKQQLGTPDALRDAVTSKGGTTAAGLKILSDNDFRGLIARTIARATERSVELGRGQP